MTNEWYYYVIMEFMKDNFPDVADSKSSVVLDLKKNIESLTMLPGTVEYERFHKYKFIDRYEAVKAILYRTLARVWYDYFYIKYNEMKEKKNDGIQKNKK